MGHYPVLKDDVLKYLNIKKGGTYVDATCGHGGHSQYILEKGEDIILYGLDKDEGAVKDTSDKLSKFKNFTAVHSGYENLDRVLEKEEVVGVDGILMDLGFSTEQIQDGERGFSFQMEGPLDMRYDRTSSLTAGEIVNRWSRNDLVYLFENYGEIKRAKKFVSALIERRKKEEFQTTDELSEFIVKYYRYRGKIHPATKFFMALRIATNDEIETIKQGLKKAADALKSSGRLVVISFHSIEDRIVKHFFRRDERLIVLTKKPVTADTEELSMNPESRSAKMRACEKI
jgi:16S rRNA (cytosine1402-N4)-methyltransferase